MNPLFYVAIAVAAVAAVIAIIFTVKRYTAIKKNGVEADAVVSRIKEVENQNDDGDPRGRQTPHQVSARKAEECHLG